MTQSTLNLQKARTLPLPSREAMLRRAPSVQAFWDDNRQLLAQAWAEWELSEADLPIPDENLLDPRLRLAINNAWADPSKEASVKDLWEEILPGVYKAQFFDPTQLARLREYLECVANAKIPTRPPYGIALNRNGAMLDPRSEGYLAAPNFQAFYRQIMDAYMRPIARLLLDTHGFDNQTFGFSIQYHPEGDKDLQPHTDASSATMNINLNLPDEPFTGSEVDFYDKESGRAVRTIFEPGVALIHRGNVPHATHPITSGLRTNMVLWLYGDRMQVPGRGASSYGNSITADTVSAQNTASGNISANERWTVPTAPLDGYAPF